MPIIVLEGIDGSGKSTLATHLKELSPWPARIIHRGPIQTTAVDEYLTPIWDADPSELLICDRWHLSELIYGPLYREESLVDTELLAKIEDILRALNAVRLIIAPPLEEVSARLQARGETFLQPHHEKLVYSAYTGLASELGYTMVPISSRLFASGLLEAMATKKLPS